jgi:hypothetical protein
MDYEYACSTPYGLNHDE